MDNFIGIKKITELKDFGPYTDFSWPDELEGLRKFNVFYGWNGAGKTTLSRLFQIIKTGSHPDYPDMKYKIVVSFEKISDGNGNTEKTSEIIEKIYDGNTISDFNDRIRGRGGRGGIRVFNTDFMENNIDFKKSESAKITIILGQENKKIEEEISRDQKNLVEINEEIEKVKKSRDEVNKNKNAKFTEVARDIAAYTEKSYDARSAKKSFQKLQGAGKFTGPSLISGEELEKYKNFIRSESKEKIPEVFSTLKDCSSLMSRIENVCQKTVDNTIIEVLENKPDLKKWVEQGFSLYEQQEWDKCAFCTNNISADRIKNLSNYFNKKYKELIGEIYNELENIKKIIKGLEQIKLPDKAGFFRDYTDEYEIRKENFEKECQNFITQLRELHKIVNEKRSYTDKSFSLPSDLTHSISASYAGYDSSLQELNNIITSHNDKVQNYEQEREKTRTKIENYYLYSISSAITELEEEISTKEKELEQKEKEKLELDKKIKENLQKINDSHQSCNALNKELEKFLGHNRIKFDVNKDKSDGNSPDASDRGFRILREGRPAKNLSDGERNSIAFIYFLSQLDDGQFDKKNSIIVIDDPISSLDSSNQYRAFEFLKEKTNGSGQLILLTHNFSFLRLVIFWFNRKEENNKKDKAKKVDEKNKTKNKNEDENKNEDITSCYMITRKGNSPNSSAGITVLDKFLKEYESEYLYLLQEVWNYREKQLNNESPLERSAIEESYRIPNIIRKLLDSFLMFQIPVCGNPKSRLDSLTTAKDRPDLKELKELAHEIYDFTNNQSHIAGEHWDSGLWHEESLKVIDNLLKIIYLSNPIHYKHLVKEVFKKEDIFKNYSSNNTSVEAISQNQPKENETSQSNVPNPDKYIMYKLAYNPDGDSFEFHFFAPGSDPKSKHLPVNFDPSCRAFVEKAFPMEKTGEYIKDKQERLGLPDDYACQVQAGIKNLDMPDLIKSIFFGTMNSVSSAGVLSEISKNDIRYLYGKDKDLRSLVNEAQARDFAEENTRLKGDAEQLVNMVEEKVRNWITNPTV